MCFEKNCREIHGCGCPCDENLRGIVTGYGRFNDDFECGVDSTCFNHHFRHDFPCCDERFRCKFTHKQITESLIQIKEGIEDDRRGIKEICEGDFCRGLRHLSEGIRKSERGICELRRNLRHAFHFFGCEEERLVRNGLCHLEKGQHEEIRGFNLIRHCNINCGIRECEMGICDLSRGVKEIERSLHKII